MRIFLSRGKAFVILILCLHLQTFPKTVVQNGLIMYYRRKMHRRGKFAFVWGGELLARGGKIFGSILCRRLSLMKQFL